MQRSRRHVGICIFCAQSRRPQSLYGPVTSFRSFVTESRYGRDRSRKHQDDEPPFQISYSISGKGTRPQGPTNLRHNEPQQTTRLRFGDALIERVRAAKKELRDAPIVEQLGEDRNNIFKHVWMTFERKIVRRDNGHLPGRDDDEYKRTMSALKTAYVQRGVSGLDDRIRYAFYGHVTGARFTETDIINQKALADLRYPIEWYPATRGMHRQIHLHVGPTNSGKTYHALKRLEAAESGVYAGPLRLLAHEIYTRLNAQGKKCLLVTGEERRAPDDMDLTGSFMSSCTVEMMPLNKTVDVAVIDEIQMIGNAERGWAWTQALLGVKAKEVHLCGEARTVPLIRELCASIGEEIIVHEYERLSPLAMARSSLGGSLKKLRKGDCIVSFSVVGIHALRRQIERDTGKKVATVYGSLPPETRAQQARLFNDPDNDYDFLVASDAIGMGLNLSIKRIIFETSTKFDGISRKPLAIADIKQIAGRAGRYRTAQQANTAAEAERGVSAGNAEKAANVELPSDPTPPSDVKADVAIETESDKHANQKSSEEVEVTSIADSPSKDGIDAISKAMSSRPPKDTSSIGLVTTLENFDFPLVEKAMRSEPEPILTAGIFPPASVVERFAQYFPPSTPFSFVMLRLHELSQMHSRFHLCGLKDQLWVADLIEPVRNLTIIDRIILCACPASKQDADLFKGLLPALARCIEQQGGGNLLDILEMPLEVLEQELSSSRFYLRELERLHKGLITYLWLSYRFAGIFSSRGLAFHVKGLVEEKIEQVLKGFSFTDKQRKSIQAAREKSVLETLRQEAEMGSEQEAHVAAQTSVVSGGDQFSGETDIEVIEPMEDEDLESVNTLVQDEAEQDENRAIAAEAMADADPLDNAGLDLSVDPSVEASTQKADEDAGISPMESGSTSGSGITSETEESYPPLETQLTTPGNGEEAVEEMENPTTATQAPEVGQVGVGGSAMPKHLHNVDVCSPETERDAPSRP